MRTFVRMMDGWRCLPSSRWPGNAPCPSPPRWHLSCPRPRCSAAGRSAAGARRHRRWRWPWPPRRSPPAPGQRRSISPRSGWKPPPSSACRSNVSSGSTVAIMAGRRGQRTASGWADVVAAVLDGFEIVLLEPPAHVGATVLRRIQARMQHRGAVLIVVGATTMPVDLTDRCHRDRVGGRRPRRRPPSRPPPPRRVHRPAGAPPSASRAVVARPRRRSGNRGEPRHARRRPSPALGELTCGGTSGVEAGDSQRRADGHRVVPGLAGDRGRHPARVPAVVLHGNHVVACSPAAAAEGVALGQRRRDAQRRCPDAVLLDHEPDRDARAFEPVVRAIGELTPRLEIVEPGWLHLATRGPSRYLGGDDALVRSLAERAPAAARIGIADGRFASGIAARIAVADRDGRAAGRHRPLRRRPPDRLAAASRRGHPGTGATAGATRPRHARRTCRSRRPRRARPIRRARSPRPPPGPRPRRPARRRRRSTATAQDRAVLRGARHRDDPGAVHRQAPRRPADRRPRRQRPGVHPAGRQDRDRPRREHGTGLVPGSRHVDVGDDRSGAMAARRLEHRRRPHCRRGDDPPGARRGAPGRRRAARPLGRAIRSRRARPAGDHPAVRARRRGAGARARMERRAPARRPLPMDPGDRHRPHRPDAPAASRRRGPLAGHRCRHPHPPWCCPNHSRSSSSPPTASACRSAGGASSAPGPRRLTLAASAPHPVLAWAGPWPLDERWWDPAASRRAARLQVVTADGAAHLLLAEHRTWWRTATYA